MATIDERRRYELYVALEELIGAEHAETLMNMAQPANVATTDDLTAVRDEIKAAKAEIKAEIAVTNRNVATLQRDVTTLQQNVATLHQGLVHTEAMLNAKIDGTAHRLEARFEANLRSTTRTLFFGTASMFIALTGVVLTAM